MVEPGKQAGFPAETLAGGFVTQPARAKGLNGDVASKAVIASAKHLTHPAGADLF
jgi:hypothetical protein